ncbi:hypothetical protein G9A89_022081 [Geosiphon pyriformis]|nr:hypothetical protein G9A89_022081 [Geosiphon pyriformis]
MTEEEEEELEDQEFTYQNLILKNPEFGTPNVQTQQENPKIETLNIQALQNQNPEVINQHLFLVIVIDQPLVKPIGQPIQIPNQQNQQPLLVPPQQQQQLSPQQQQQMTYAPITKLDKFTGEKDNTQVWLNDVEKAITANGWNDARAMQTIPYFLKNTADSWYQSLVDKPQDFNTFKLEFLRYFSNNNSINRLANTFTTIKQGETEAVTTYLGRFHRNLQQIQAIDANYFTASQILNQFICGLYSSILQHVCPLHPATLQDAVTHARNFESAELETNHTHAVNLVMNKSFELDSKLKQFSDSINQNHVYYYHQLHLINCGSQKHVFATTVISNSKLLPKSRLNYPPINDTVTNLSTTSILNSSLSDTCNLSTTAASNLSATTSSNLLNPTTNSNTITKLTSKQTPKAENDTTKLQTESCQWNSGTGATQNPNSQNYLSLLVTSEDTTNTNSGSNQQLTLTSNILPTTITKDKSLTAIFPFEFEETTAMPLFSKAVFKAKPITAMYTDAKVNGQSIKLILDSSSAGNIITQQLMDQLGRQVDCTTSTRIITANGATKTPISEIDEFPFEVNSIITPIKVLVMEATQYQTLIGNDWLSKTNTILDWMTQELQLSINGQHTCVPATSYQVSWADNDHNKLPPRTNQESWSNDGQSESATKWSWEEKGKGKEQKEEPKQTTTSTHIPYVTSPQNAYSCGNTLLDEEIWKDIPGRGGACNETCQYTILINNWVQKRTPINDVWKQALRCLERYLHDENEIWRITYAMSEGATTKELREIKNNPLFLPEPEYVQTFNVFGNIKDDPEKFHEHYQ